MYDTIRLQKLDVPQSSIITKVLVDLEKEINCDILLEGKVNHSILELVKGSTVLIPNFSPEGVRLNFQNISRGSRAIYKPNNIEK